MKRMEWGFGENVSKVDGSLGNKPEFLTVVKESFRLQYIINRVLEPV